MRGAEIMRARDGVVVVDDGDASRRSWVWEGTLVGEDGHSLSCISEEGLRGLGGWTGRILGSWEWHVSDAGSERFRGDGG